MAELSYDDVSIVVGRLSLENYRLTKDFTNLEAKVKELTDQVNTLKQQAKAKFITVTPDEPEVANGLEETPPGPGS